MTMIFLILLVEAPLAHGGRESLDQGHNQVDDLDGLLGHGIRLIRVVTVNQRPDDCSHQRLHDIIVPELQILSDKTSLN
jgi:hypothetical protein